MTQDNIPRVDFNLSLAYIIGNQKTVTAYNDVLNACVCTDNVSTDTALHYFTER